MTIRISKPPVAVRSLLARLAGVERRIGEPPATPQAFTGDGSTTVFPCVSGVRPIVVWTDGVMQREGAGDGFTLRWDGTRYNVVFAVAPANAARIDVLHWRIR